MTAVERLLPLPGMVTVDRLLGDLGGGLRPFDPEVVDLGQHLSERLLADPLTRRRPELAALAFGLRRAATAALAGRFAAGLPDGTLAVPRGLAFCVAPGNVETMFGHGWFLSLLCGNRTIVRLPSARGELAALLLGHVAGALDAPRFARARAATALVAYGHEAEVTAALSAACDLRVVWGGDRTVAALRSVPLPPGAVEIVFPDRQSLAALAADAYLAVDAVARRELVRRFVADAYGFDQMACSSPRALVWCGAAAACAEAAGDFRRELGRQVKAGIDTAPATALSKLADAARAALDGGVRAVHRDGAGLAVIEVDTDAPLPDCAVGGGLFAELHLPRLADLATRLGRRHQTLVHFGFTRAELEDLVVRLNGRALDRLVPVGKALEFAPVWDGIDLPRAFTRLVHVEG